MSGFRRAYSIAGVVLLALMALQFYLIAAAAWSVWGATPSTGDPTSGEIFSGFRLGDGFATLHAIDGTIVIPLTILVMIGLAFGARHTARVKWLTAALFGLMVVQFFLGFFGGVQTAAGSAVAGLHGLNAMALVGLAIYLVRGNWAFASRPVSAEPTPPPLT
jgi:hypothetical protein